MDLTYSSCPVTALSFYNSETKRTYLLAGEDGALKIFDVTTRVLLASARVFEEQAIRGFATSRIGSAPNVLIWGGRSVAVLPGHKLEDLVSGLAAPAPVGAEAPDRILDGLLSYHRPVGVLVTAHNELLSFSWNRILGHISLGTAISPGRLLLFSAKAALLDNRLDNMTVLVAAGTVSGKIIVWRCKLPDGTPDMPNGSLSVLAVLTGHEGSIFGVDISPCFNIVSGRRRRLLASCSDDRTIRIWDLEQLLDGSTTSGLPDGALSAGVLKEARETGFQTHAVVSSAKKLTPIAIATGHTSRIWHVQCTPRLIQQIAEEKKLVVYSFGEDATAQEWHLHLDDEVAGSYREGSLNHWKTTTSHSGRHIWGAAILGQLYDKPIVATGGADGGISLLGGPPDVKIWRSNGQHDNKIKNSVIPPFSVQNLQAEEAKKYGPKLPPATAATDNGHDGLGHSTAFFREHAVQRYHYLTPNQLLLATAPGHLYLASYDNWVPIWTRIDILLSAQLDLASYCVMGGFWDGEVFIGTASGTIYLYQLQNGLKIVAKLAGKTSGIFPLCRQPGMRLDDEGEQSEDLRGAAQSRELLVTVLGSNKATLLRIAGDAGNEPDCEHTLELDEHAVVMAANNCGAYTLIGTRTGWLSVYEKVDDHMRKVLSNKVTARKDAVTCILPLQSTSHHNPLHFLTTSRDGMYRIYALSGHLDKLDLCLFHEVQAAFGPTIEGAWLVGRANRQAFELALCGFSGKAFKVWNETKRREIVSVDCGGGHRSFAFAPLQDSPEGFRFAFTKASTLYMYAQQSTETAALQDGGHGREIRAVACNGDLVATGSEDTTIRISRFLRGNGKENSSTDRLECLAVLAKHTAGLQCLTWCGPIHLISGSGNEELFIWRVWPLETRLRGLAVVCEAICPPITPAGDLRIMSIDAELKQIGDAEEMLVSVALSDSTLRTYAYDNRKDGKFRLLGRGHYTGACLTQIRHLRMEDERLAIATAATDGYVAIWAATMNKLGNEISGMSCYTTSLITRLHRNSIKALDMIQLPGDTSTWLFATGGDDNAFSLLPVTLDRHTSSFSVGAKFKNSTAHAAAITGIKIVAAEQSMIRLVTTGCDQRIKVWRIAHDRGDVRGIAKVEDRYSAVADAGDLALLGDKQCAVVGIGTEIWRLE